MIPFMLVLLGDADRGGKGKGSTGEESDIWANTVEGDWARGEDVRVRACIGLWVWVSETGAVLEMGSEIGRMGGTYGTEGTGGADGIGIGTGAGVSFLGDESVRGTGLENGVGGWG